MFIQRLISVWHPKLPPSSSLKTICESIVKKYKDRHDVKLLGISSNIKKIKDLMKKQKRDDERGVIYGTGTALDTDTFPEYTKQAEKEKKKVAKVICPLYGCIVKGHVTTGSKRCVYHQMPSKQETNDKMHAHLQPLYLTHYGECYQYLSRSHPMVPTTLLQKIVYGFSEGLSGSRLPLWEII